MNSTPDFLGTLAVSTFMCSDRIVLVRVQYTLFFPPFCYTSLYVAAPYILCCPILWYNKHSIRSAVIVFAMKVEIANFPDMLMSQLLITIHCHDNVTKA